MSTVKVWLEAFRLRTLPLALSCIFMGAFLAFYFGHFNALIFVLAILTTLFLQILSNVANDYGDAVKGTDNENRLGPPRAVQSGAISAQSMKNAVIIFAILSLLSGVTLLFVSFSGISIETVGLFLLGIGAIAAAIKYTVGEGAYGYRGLGDVFVLLFFGIIGVGGSYYLFSQELELIVLLPAFSIGLFSMGVLNLNNLRDIDNDRDSGKNTIIVVYGARFGRLYHLMLIVTAWICSIVFMVLEFNSIAQLLFLLSLPLFIANLKKVFTYQNPRELIPSLKQLAMGTFIFTLLFGIGLIISSMLAL